MSYIIVIRGPLGVGKSTISQQLAKERSARYIPLDDVLSRLDLDQVPPDAECIPAENFITALDSVRADISQSISGGQDVVIDACFYHREMIEFLEKHWPEQIIVFTLSAPLETCISRDSARHKRHGEDAARAVYLLVDRVKIGIPINAATSADQTLQDVQRHLPKIHG